MLPDHAREEPSGGGGPGDQTQAGVVGRQASGAVGAAGQGDDLLAGAGQQAHDVAAEETGRSGHHGPAPPGERCDVDLRIVSHPNHRVL